MSQTVQVRGKTEWDVGVASESVTRKGKIRLSPNNGFWTVWLRNGDEYKALAGPGVFLSLKSKPQKVGVFVDYEERLVSFYDVDTTALIFLLLTVTSLKISTHTSVPVVTTVEEMPPHSSSCLCATKESLDIFSIDLM